MAQLVDPPQRAQRFEVLLQVTIGFIHEFRLPAADLEVHGPERWKSHQRGAPRPKRTVLSIYRFINYMNARGFAIPSRLARSPAKRLEVPQTRRPVSHRETFPVQWGSLGSCVHSAPTSRIRRRRRREDRDESQSTSDSLG